MILRVAMLIYWRGKGEGPAGAPGAVGGGDPATVVGAGCGAGTLRPERPQDSSNVGCGAGVGFWGFVLGFGAAGGAFLPLARRHFAVAGPCSCGWAGAPAGRGGPVAGAGWAGRLAESCSGVDSMGSAVPLLVVVGIQEAGSVRWRGSRTLPARRLLGAAATRAAVGWEVTAAYDRLGAADAPAGGGEGAAWVVGTALAWAVP